MKKFLASAATVAALSTPVTAHASEEYNIPVLSGTYTSSIFLVQEFSRLIGFELGCLNNGLETNPLSDEIRCVRY